MYPQWTGMREQEAFLRSELRQLLGPQLLARWPQNASEMLALENERRRFGHRQTDLLTSIDLLRVHQDSAFINQSIAVCRRQRRLVRLHRAGWREVTVRLQHGGTLRLWTPYLRPARPGRGIRGCYPVLLQLGIEQSVTPAARSAIARQVVVSASYAEAHEQLAQQGLTIPRSMLVSVAVQTGAVAIHRQEAALDAARKAPLPRRGALAGQRVLVCVDGGKVRTRRRLPGVKRGRHGRHPFEAPWREPRMITLILLTKAGRIDRDHRPIYLVSLKGADGVFSDLLGLLRLLGAAHAQQVTFISDGAQWVWERINRLCQDAEIPEHIIEKSIDFWHALQQLHGALLACKNLSESDRSWHFKCLRRQLLEEDGGVDAVIAALKPLARGRRAPNIKPVIKYFQRHRQHMQYQRLRWVNRPIGSGVVESAIRRVINLRFKAASTVWKEETLKSLLPLRAIAKSGRWDDFFKAHINGQHWLASESSAETHHDTREQKAA